MYEGGTECALKHAGGVMEACLTVDEGLQHCLLWRGEVLAGSPLFSIGDQDVKFPSYSGSAISTSFFEELYCLTWD